LPYIFPLPWWERDKERDKERGDGRVKKNKFKNNKYIKKINS